MTLYDAIFPLDFSEIVSIVSILVLGVSGMFLAYQNEKLKEQLKGDENE